MTKLRLFRVVSPSNAEELDKWIRDAIGADHEDRFNFIVTAEELLSPDKSDPGVMLKREFHFRILELHTRPDNSFFVTVEEKKTGDIATIDSTDSGMQFRTVGDS